MSDVVTCLCSHECSDENHTMAQALKAALGTEGIDVLIDPFRLGDEVSTRIDAVDFDCLLFLSSPGSRASKFCRRELLVAQRRSVPLFVALLTGDVARPMRGRIYWRVPVLGSPAFVDGVKGLAEQVHPRVDLSRELRRLSGELPPFEMIECAKRIALDTDSTLVAEVAAVIARRYSETEDATTRFWLAQSLGSAGTPKAAELLGRLQRVEHDLYALEGIKQALAMIPSAAS